MKLFLILATAVTLSAAGSRSFRNEPHRFRESDRRANLDYEDIQTADQNEVDRFEDHAERSDSRKSNRIGIYSTAHSIQVSKSKAAQRRHSKVPGAKDSEASGTHFEGAHYGAPQEVTFIKIWYILDWEVEDYKDLICKGYTNTILMLILIAPLLVAGPGPGIANHPGGLIENPGGLIGNPGGPVGPVDDLGTDITKSVYVFSAPPDPFDYAPRQTVSKVPQRPQKHYQVLFINAPSPAPPHQHHVELPPPPELKTLVYVLVKKPERPPPINFIRGPAGVPGKPEIYFIRYRGKGYGLSPSPVGPHGEEQIPLGHPGGPGIPYSHIAPHHPQEELRGNVDYGPSGPSQYDGPAPYELDEYQDDSHLAASQHSQHQHISQRNPGREIDAGVSGI
ncbi:hypothetical protein Ocin01_05563 [Orchesella cincta]|uniref:DUF243 domain-containing protein n=1 Tax=Orchesella cincta TaxID=48709 RepID=A0A1D2N773_ORCCI|nr:hypothetical protein Ocin01_05563 [Orchesella cincta]